MSDTPSKTRSAEVFFAVVFFVFSAFLLSQLGEQAKFSFKGKFASQPAFWPGIGVLGMTVFSGLHLFTRYRNRAGDTLFPEVSLWLRALEFVGWFMVYVVAVPRIGYLQATLIFTTLLAFRMGYRKPKTLLAAAASGFCIVLVFKTILSVKIPAGAVYEYLPNAMRNFMIVNF